MHFKINGIVLAIAHQYENLSGMIYLMIYRIKYCNKKVELHLETFLSTFAIISENIISQMVMKNKIFQLNVKCIEKQVNLLGISIR